MNDVVEMEQAPRAVVVAPQAAMVAATPADLMRYALDSGADLDRLEKLMEMQERWEAGQARKAFVADMAAFKMDPPEIVKDKLVGFENKDGSFTGYKHATLGNVCGAIIEGLAKNGFSHRWNTEQKDGGQIFVTCILTHKLGHSESTVLNSGRDDSGKKNSIQAMASTVTYLQRYTLLAATGIAAKDQADDDGQEAGGQVAEPVKTVARPIISGKNFDKAIAAIQDGSYTSIDMRNYYALTAEQETILVDAEKVPA